MDDTTIARYQPGGDIYATLQSQYGTDGANQVAAAARTGDNNGEVRNAIANITPRDGQVRDSSTGSLLLNQLTTDPLAAPLQSLNNQVANAVGNIFKNPWVLVGVAALIFGFLGGFTMLRGTLAKRA